MKAIEVIKNLINVVGSSVGVIMIAIGGVMFLGAFLKLYVFGLEKGQHFQPYRCDEIMRPVGVDDVDMPIKGNQYANLSFERRQKLYDECIHNELKNEKERYVNQQKHAMIDGFTFGVVGLPILVFYMRRSRRMS
jgi:hypothetical protein